MIAKVDLTTSFEDLVAPLPGTVVAVTWMQAIAYVAGGGRIEVYMTTDGNVGAPTLADLQWTGTLTALYSTKAWRKTIFVTDQERIVVRTNGAANLQAITATFYETHSGRIPQSRS